MRGRGAGVVNEALDEAAGCFELAALGQQECELNTRFSVLGVEHQHALKMQFCLRPGLLVQGGLRALVGLVCLKLGAGAVCRCGPAQKQARQKTGHADRQARHPSSVRYRDLGCA